MMKIILLLLLTLSTLFGAIGEVTALKGEAQLQRLEQILSVDKGTQVETKDLLETQRDSKVQVILNDDTVITIGPTSSYYFEAYEDKTDTHVMMELKHGFFKIVTGKIGKIAPERFKVKTKAATIGIRGTQFMASVQDEHETIACSKGSLVVETQTKTFELPAGMMLVYEDHSWSMYELDTATFEPLLIQDSPLTKTPLQKRTELLPNYSQRYTPLEQQIDKEHDSF